MDQAIYHAYNRGVERRDLFLDKKDYLRFIQNLYEFNDHAPIKTTSPDYREERLTLSLLPRDPLVDILSFCLMPNHFHIMVREREMGALTTFMRKIGTGYTNYFNKKYRRVGHLFQGKYKSVLLESDAHFLHLPHYIHLNPIDLLPKSDPQSTLHKLENYLWSSLPDYLGKENFPEITERKFLIEHLGDPEQIRKDTLGWIEERNFDFTSDVFIDIAD